METRVRRVWPVWSAMACAALAGEALGQLQAQDGRALDRNNQVGAMGYNTRVRDFGQELRFRNAIVTGNAADGLSFRGDVGYTAPGEFFGRLGSNEFFSYRRDSAYSGLAGMGIRGTDALQYQFAMTTGNRPPPDVTGSLLVNRSGGAASSRTPVLTEKPVGAPNAAGTLTDVRGLTLWALRSPAAYVANKGLSATLVGTVEGQSQLMGVTASALRGVSVEPLQGVTGWAPEGMAPKPVEKPVVSADSGKVELTATPQELAPYEQLLADLAKVGRPEVEVSQNPTDPKGQGTPEWAKRIDDLRRHLEQAGREAKAPPEEKLRDERPADSAASDVPEFDASTLDLIKWVSKARPSLQRLAPEGYDPYSVHMEAGQRLLASGQYFDAEERFTAALSMKNGDTMASAGRIHAQLGSGMYLSASINLRSLLVEHPELAAVRFGEGLLPSAQRIRQVMEYMENASGDPRGLTKDAGLVLAYLGWQLGDLGAVNRGLDQMEARAGEGESADEQLRTLARLLRRVWTESAPELEPLLGPVPPAQPAAPTPDK